MAGEAQEVGTEAQEEARSFDDFTADDVVFPGEETTPEDTDAEDSTTEEENTDPSTDGEEENTTSDSNEEQNTESNSSDEGEPNDNEGNDDDDVRRFQSLTETTGLEVNSEDDIVKALTEYAKVKDKDPLADLSPGIQEAIKAEKAGMDLNHFFSLRSMDFDTMDSKEVLRQKFLRDNPDLKDNKDFANRKFEREYVAKYGMLNKQFDDDEEKAEFERENREDIEYTKMALDHDVKSGREELKKWKEEATKIPESTGQDSDNVSEEDAGRFAEEHATKVDNYFKEFDGIEIGIGDEKAFKLGFEGKEVQRLQEAIKNPAAWLNKIGFGDNGIDVEKLAPVVALVESHGKIGKLLTDYALESKNRETIESRLENPGDPANVNSQQPGVKDEWEKIGDAFDQRHEAGY